MLTGLSLQSLAYVMVAIALGMQSTAPFEVRYPSILVLAI